MPSYLLSINCFEDNEYKYYNKEYFPVDKVLFSALG